MAWMGIVIVVESTVPVGTNDIVREIVEKRTSHPLIWCRTQSF